MIVTFDKKKTIAQMIYTLRMYLVCWKGEREIIIFEKGKWERIDIHLSLVPRKRYLKGREVTRSLPV